MTEEGLSIVFAGSAEFSIPCLQALMDSSHQVTAVYTQPDRPAGRGKKLTSTPVKQLATAANIPVYQPLHLKDGEAQLAALKPDLMIVVAYGLLLPKTVLATPSLGCLNVHGSVLPRWRGAAPIQYALLAGDSETGITIMQMDAGLDTGPMLSTSTCPILPNDTAGSLHDRLAPLGAALLIDTLAKRSALSAQPQDNSQATYATKISKASAAINWQESALTIDRKIRAFNPWPIAYTHTVDKQNLRIHHAKISAFSASNAAPGIIVNLSRQAITVSTQTGCLDLLEIQFPGKKPLPINAVLNAAPAWLDIGYCFDPKSGR